MAFAITKIVMIEVIGIRIMTVMITITMFMVVATGITMFMVVATSTRQTGILKHQQIPLIQCRRPILVTL
jgi:hypothetical protein